MTEHMIDTQPAARPATRAASRRQRLRRTAAIGVVAGATAASATLTAVAAERDGTAPAALPTPSRVAALADVAPQPIAVRTVEPRRAVVRASRTRTAPTRVSRRPAAGFVAAGRSFSGEASWYGPGFQGRRTASGERYDMYAMTAAHRSLAFGTRLRVCRADRCVVVRINDRGPFVGNRVLDLSKAAAQALGYTGTAYVTATPVRAA